MKQAATKPIKFRTKANRSKLDNNPFLAETIVINEEDPPKILCSLCGDKEKEEDWFYYG